MLGVNTSSAFASYIWREVMIVTGRGGGGGALVELFKFIASKNILRQGAAISCMGLENSNTIATRALERIYTKSNHGGSGQKRNRTQNFSGAVAAAPAPPPADPAAPAPIG